MKKVLAIILVSAALALTGFSSAKSGVDKSNEAQKHRVQLLNDI